MQKSTYLILFFLFFTNQALGKIREFETTHLKSTAGAGVGSILLEESSILNPAPIAFYKTSSLYFQKMGTNIQNQNTKNPYTAPASDLIAIIASDTKGRGKGSVSYVNQNEGFSKRKRIAGSMSYLIAKQSAMGITYSYTMENLYENNTLKPEEKYHQITAGFTHIVDEKITVGIIFVDPLQTKPEETKAIMGFQYSLQDFISLIFDAGADYNKDLAETVLYRAATQIKVYDNFFMRVGLFDDKGLKEKGNGAGLSWIGPKLMAEIAVKNSTVLEDSINKLPKQKIKETSFSLSYRF